MAQEKHANWLFVDEIKARTIAQRLGLQIIGTAGLLLYAKRQAKIVAVRPLLEALRIQRFRLSDKVYKAVLDQAGE